MRLLQRTYESKRAARIIKAHRSAHRSLKGYIHAVWSILNSGTELVWGPTQDAICEHVEAWTLGVIPFLLVEVPPGSSKSTIGSRCAPCWSWHSARPDLAPSWRWMCGSYNDELSNYLNTQRRKLLTDPRIIALMRTPVQLAKGEKNKGRFENEDGGFMQAISPEGGVTGFHCERQILDDVLKPKDVLEAGAKLVTTLNWMESTIPSRFGNQTLEAVALINQRLGDGDASEKFVEMYPNTVRLTIPAEYNPARSTVTVLPFGGDRPTATPNPILLPLAKLRRHHKGFEDWRTVERETFDPMRFPPSVLEKKRHQLKVNYHAQFNQNPVQPGGTLIKVDMFHRHRSPPDLTGAEVIIAADTAFTDSKRADDTAIQVWAATKARGAMPPRIWLLDQVFGQIDFMEMVDAFNLLAERWPIKRRIIEAGGKGSGDSLVATLRRQGVHVKPVSYRRGSASGTSKTARVHHVSPLIEGRFVSVPTALAAPWSTNFIAECEAFPLIKADGQVDAMVIALQYFAPRFGLNISSMLVDLDAHRKKVARPPRRPQFRP